MSPLDENNQALVIRLHRTPGDLRGGPSAVRGVRRRCSATSSGSHPGPPSSRRCARRCRRPRRTVNRASVEAILEAGAAAVAAGAGESGVASLRTAVRLADDAGDVVAADVIPARARRGPDPLGARAGRGGPRRPARRRPHRRRSTAIARVMARGPHRARLRRLPASPVRPRRALARRRDLAGAPDRRPRWPGRGCTSAASTSDRADYAAALAQLEAADVLLHAGAREPGARLRPLHAGTRPPAARRPRPAADATSGPRSRRASGTAGSRSSRGRRRCSARSSSPAVASMRRTSCCSRRSPGPASSGIRAGRACPPGRRAWSRRRAGRWIGRSTCWRTPGCAATVSRTATCGWTRTSSMRSARSACAHAHPETAGVGRGHAAAGRTHGDAGDDRSLAAARCLAGRSGRCGGRRAHGRGDRQSRGAVAVMELTAGCSPAS